LKFLDFSASVDMSFMLASLNRYMHSLTQLQHMGCRWTKGNLFRSTIDSLTNLTSIKYIYCHADHHIDDLIADVVYLKSVTRLQKLHIINRILLECASDILIENLCKLTSIRNLNLDVYIGKNSISKISLFASLPKLEDLSIQLMTVGEISPFVNAALEQSKFLTRLQNLKMNFCSMRGTFSLSPLIDKTPFVPPKSRWN
jgi:hypothetical protein